MSTGPEQPAGGYPEPPAGGPGVDPDGGPAAGGPGSSGTRRRQRRLVVVIPLVLAVVATAGLIALTWLVKPQAKEPSSGGGELATTEMTRRDLVQQVTVDATVGYGRSSVVTGRKPGTLTSLPSPGTVVHRGEPLFSVDAVGVWLLYGGTPTYRPLSSGVPAGPDILVLQQNLVAMGYSKVRTNGRFDAATCQALRAWQKKLKLEQTGTLQPQDVVVLPGAVRVDSVTAQLGDPAVTEIMKVTGTERVVTADLDLSQRQLAEPGTAVQVVLVDGRSTGGTVRSVVITAAAQSQSDAKPKAAVTISLDDAKVAETVQAGPATVRFDGERRTGVLAVPVEALLALREGGYAVEVVDADGGHRLVGVRLGLFAEGMVEVVGDGLAEGTRVVTTS